MQLRVGRRGGRGKQSVSTVLPRPRLDGGAAEGGAGFGNSATWAQIPTLLSATRPLPFTAR